MRLHLLHLASRTFGLLLILLGIFSSSVQAQTLPPTTSDDEMGMQPYQSYHGGAIDSIGLTNGMLNLNLPFVVYPQRGKLQLSFNLFYNNDPQHIAEFCPPPPGNNAQPQNPPSCTWYWGLPPVESSLPLEKGDVFVGSAQTKYLIGVGAKQVFQQFTNYYENWSVQDADGSKHVLGNQGTLIQTGSSPQFLYQGSGPWESLDATGWRVNGTLTAVPDTSTWQVSNGIVIP